MDTIIKFCAQDLFLFVVAGTVAVGWMLPKANRLRFGVAVVLAGIIALVLSRVAAKLYYDPRPFVTEHVKPLISHAADNGFPSDHALLTMTLTAITYFFNKKIAAGMLVLTVIVGWARIAAKIHSLLDIGGAWLIGVVAAAAAYYLAYWWFNRRHSQSAD
jgi:undecaprenyl-diphosphatase